jgi:hypothetical protein
MTMLVGLKSTKLLDWNWRYLIDILWDATLVFAIAFVVVMILIFTIGYAIDLGFIIIFPRSF